MPFTLGGDYIPNEELPPKPKGPVKVRLEKRGNATVTLILNLPLKPDALTELAAKLKRKLGCGGAVKEGVIEIQGEKVEQVKKLLLESGIKSQ